MTDIERIEEYLTNLTKPCEGYRTIDYDAIDILDVKPCLHKFEGQETDDAIYVVTNMEYRSIGFLHVEVDIYIAMISLNINKKLIELITYSSTEDYGPYQTEFVNNGCTYMASEYIKLALNDDFKNKNLIILDIILYRCMTHHKNIITFEKILNKHGDIDIVTKLLDEWENNRTLYTKEMEYKIPLLRWINDHSIEEDIRL